MPWGIAAGVAGAGLIGDLFSAQGQQQTNAMQQAMMLQNEQWQTQMSNTAMQRRVTDLKAAGLNPLLAVNTPGASVPGVGQPQLGNPGQAFGNLGSQAASAVSAAQQQQQTAFQGQMTAANVEKAQADARASRASAALDESRAPFAAAQAKNTADNIQALSDKYAQEIKNFKQDWDLTAQKIEQLRIDNSFRNELDQLTNRGAALNNQRLTYGMAELAADSKFWSGEHAAAAAAAKAYNQGGVYAAPEALKSQAQAADAAPVGGGGPFPNASEWVSRRIDNAVDIWKSFLGGLPSMPTPAPGRRGISAAPVNP